MIPSLQMCIVPDRPILLRGPEPTINPAKIYCISNEPVNGNKQSAIIPMQLSVCGIQRWNPLQPPELSVNPARVVHLDHVEEDEWAIVKPIAILLLAAWTKVPL